MKTCTFFGHKDTPEKIKPTLRSAIVDLIEHYNVNKFYVGNQGHFDNMVYNILKELSKQYKNYVVLAYIPKSECEFENNKKEDTLLPDGIEKVHRRFAISYRNKWMIDQSNFVITYVTHSWGGASQFKEMAEKKKKVIIDITKNEY